MIRRPTWVLVVLLAALAALVYYMQTVPDNLIKKVLTGATPTKEVIGGLLFLPTDGPIKGISFEGSDGHSIALKEEDAGWTLSVDGQGPVPADQNTVAQAATMTMNLRVLTSMSTPPADLSGFGFDKPAYIFKAILGNGQTATFKIGNATVTDSGYYLQEGNGTISIVDKYGIDALLAFYTQPPYMFPPTASPVPATETPTAAVTPTSTALTDLTPTKQP